MPSAGEMPRQALVGVRVLDFTSLLAGPFPTLLMGFLGAEVIKVESRTRLDPARRPPYAYDDPERSPVFNSINLNKLSVQLNLRRPEAVELARSLVSVSDVVVENMRPGVMDRLGLGYPRLRKANPSIIMASASSAGAVGPERAYPGYAPVFNSLGGLGHLTGYPDAPPTELRDSIDARVGATTAFAALTALFHRLRTGQGQLIDLSSREAITAFGVEALMEYLMAGRITHRQGNREQGMAPHGCYRCRGEDAWVAIAVADEAQWQALCRAAGHSEWAADPRFADPFLRYQNQDALDGMLSDWTQAHTAEEVTATLQAAGVAAAPSLSGPDLASDRHLNARGVWQEVVHPVLGSQRVQGPPWQFSETPPRVRTAGPVIGQHNYYVFVELLGVDPDEVASMVEAGIIS